MTLGSHQQTIGRNQARFTPRTITDPVGPFPTDAAAGDPRPWDIGTVRNITAAMNCLAMDWAEFGETWLNPPFDRRVVGAFVRKMAEHDNGVMLLHARTETAWFAPVWERAGGLLFLGERVVFLKEDGTPITIENPEAKHYGRVANSGAPVVLAAFGETCLERLAFCGLNGKFVPLLFPRSVLAEFVGTWREAIEAEFPAGPFRTDDLYRRFAAHPKARGNRHAREKLRQTLNRGGFERLGRGLYRRGGADG